MAALSTTTSIQCAFLALKMLSVQYVNTLENEEDLGNGEEMGAPSKSHGKIFWPKLGYSSIDEQDLINPVAYLESAGERNYTDLAPASCRSA